MFRSDLKRAIKEISLGQPVGLPTETVYGLAAAIDQPLAIEKIFKLKQRPFFDPLIVHVGSMEQAQGLVSWWPPEAQALAEHCWPGPLTLVLPKASHIDSRITSGLDSVAVRWPKHPLFQEVLDEVKVPLAAPSANKFGRTSPTHASHVQSEFKDDAVFVLDGGPCEVGIESTVLKLYQEGNKVQASILRKGFFTEQALKEVLSSSQIVFKEIQDRRESPGNMKHHYMPPVPFVISKAHKDLGQISHQIFERVSALPDVIDHVKIQKPLHPPRKILELKLSEDPRLASREFYSELRRLAEIGCDSIVFFKYSVHQGEPWEALFDRMTKAASLVLSD